MLFLSRFRICFFGFLFYCAVGFFSSALAVTTEDQAKLAADNFLGFLGSSKTIRSLQFMSSNHLDPSKPAVLSGWVIDLSGGGYVLIASSQKVSPVKAYSLKMDYASLPILYRNFLEKELELYARLETDTASSGRTSLSLPEKTAAETAWTFLLNMDPADRLVQSYTPDTHLLTTTWNQGYPYNKFLPQIDGRSALAGCVNIALAQVMKYHGYPHTGAGSSTYTWIDESLKTVLNHPYYWENMPDAPGMATPEHLQDEVAILIRDLAIVNQTSFGLDGSSAYMHKEDFVRFFGYSNALSSMDNSNADDFFATLKAQIDLELPVLMSFPGHMVVVDGYAVDPTGIRFHVNMGWGGFDDNYYYLDETVKTTSYWFEPDLDIIYNIKPCSGPDCVTPDLPSTDIPPRLNTSFKDIMIPADDTASYLIRIDARDENADDITFSTRLSNSETISAEIVNDILTIQPLPDSQNKAATVEITALAGGKTVQAEFLVMVADQDVTFGKDQTIKGVFENESAIYTHQAILEGDCTISGDRGYSNQAFYISIQDSQGQIVIPATDGADTPSAPAVQHNFPFGLYTISASLTMEPGSPTSPYYLLENYDEYVIGITAPQADATLEEIAGLMGVDMTKTDFSVPEDVKITGDISNDGLVNLEDKLLALKIITGIGDVDAFDNTDDASGDGKIGIEEALFWENKN